MGIMQTVSWEQRAGRALTPTAFLIAMTCTVSRHSASGAHAAGPLLAPCTVHASSKLQRQTPGQTKQACWLSAGSGDPAVEGFASKVARHRNGLVSPPSAAVNWQREDTWKREKWQGKQ